MRIIKRWECGWLRNTKSWLLVYGRRKTGKTFLLKNCVDWSLYLTATRTGEAVVERGGGVELIPSREALDVVLKELRKGGKIIIDEFQRLPPSWLDVLASARADARGQLILCGSSLAVARKIFGERSPLLGLMAPFRVGLAAFEDAYNAFRGMKFRRAIEWATVARDPWILGLVDPVGDAATFLARKCKILAPSAAGLVGEVFLEEERSITRLYDATLRLLADGYWSSATIAAKLYEQGLIQSPSQSTVTGVLNVLASMGLVDKIPLWRSRGARTFYRHKSSLLALLLYMEERYTSIGAEPSPGAVDARLGVEVQFELGKLLARWKGLRLGYSLTEGGDIDVVLLSRRGPIIGYELKRGAFTEKEAKKAVETIRRAGIPKAGLVSLEETPPYIADENLGPAELRKILASVKKTRQTP